MSRIVDTVNRVLGRSVRDLAGEVDEALGRLAQARGLEAVAQDTLRLAQHDVVEAQAAVAAARDALFTEHPDLAPSGWNQMSLNQATQEVPMHRPDPGPGLDPSTFDPEPVEVDDADDPRFTGGVPAVPSSDSEPLPPIVWGEHDD